MTNPIVISERVREQILAVVRFAESHPRTAEMLEASERQVQETGMDRPSDIEATVDIPCGYRCFYTIDHYATQMMRNLSVENDDPDCGITRPMLTKLSEEFGYVRDIASYILFVGTVKHPIVHLFQYIVSRGGA